MAKYDRVRIGSEKKLKSIEELRSDPNFIKLLDKLHCPGTRCHARLCYREGSRGYLASYPNEIHSDDCEYGYKGEVRADRRRREIIQGKLSESAIRNKRNAGRRKLLEYLQPSTMEKPAKRNRRRSVVDDDGSTATTEVKPGGSKTVDTTSQGRKVRAYPTPHILLHHITNERIGSYVQIIALVREININEQNNGYIKIELGGEFGRIALPEAFFASTEIGYGRVGKNFKLIGDFIKNQTEDVYMCVICEYEGEKDRTHRFTASNPDYVSFVVNEKTATVSALVSRISS